MCGWSGEPQPTHVPLPLAVRAIAYDSKVPSSRPEPSVARRSGGTCFVVLPERKGPSTAAPLRGAFARDDGNWPYALLTHQLETLRFRQQVLAELRVGDGDQAQRTFVGSPSPLRGRRPVDITFDTGVSNIASPFARSSRTPRALGGQNPGCRRGPSSVFVGRPG